MELKQKIPGEENGNPLQYSCLEKFHGQRRLVGCSTWGCKESNITLWLTKAEYGTGNQTVNPEIKYIQLLSKVVICLE